MSDTAATGRFDIHEIAATLPETADTLLVDVYLTNRESASARVFRVYRGTPPHYHNGCDEYLLVVSGRGTFWMGDESTKAEFGPGQLLFFQRGTVHALPDIIVAPLVFLSFDTPRREPTDIVLSILKTARQKPSWLVTRETIDARSDVTPQRFSINPSTRSTPQIDSLVL